MRVGWLLTAPLPHWAAAGVTGFDEEGDIEKGWRKVRARKGDAAADDKESINVLASRMN